MFTVDSTTYSLEFSSATLCSVLYLWLRARSTILYMTQFLAYKSNTCAKVFGLIGIYDLHSEPLILALDRISQFRVSYLNIHIGFATSHTQMVRLGKHEWKTNKRYHQKSMWMGRNWALDIDFEYILVYIPLVCDDPVGQCHNPPTSCSHHQKRQTAPHQMHVVLW